MKFLKLDKKKGSGGPSIKSRYAYLIHIDDIDYLPGTNEKGVRLEGDILLKEDCTMMPLYLTSSSQEFSYDILGDDDEKSYLVKFSGNHPGTELEALEFAKNMIEQPYLVLIPSCNESEPWKLLGELTNPLIFTSSHKGGSDSSKFTFNFEQRIGSEFIYFSYGGVEVPSDDGGGVQPPNGGFDPTKWARIDASNIDDHIAAWRTKLGIGSGDTDFTQHGPITTTSNSVTIGLSELGENFAMIAGIKYIEPTTNPETPKPFTAVTTGNKVLIIEARPDAQVFHLVEGTEDAVITDPPYTGLLVARVIVTPTGVIIQEEDSTYKNKSDDTIAPIILNNDTATWVFGDRTNYDITATGLVTAPILAGFKYADSSPAIWNGKKSIIRNRTGFPLFFEKVTPPADALIYFPFKEDYTIADGKDAAVIYDNNNEVALIDIGGGGASFPELGNDGEVLVKSGTNALWSNRLNIVEDEIDAEIVNRALEDLKKLDKPLSPNDVNTRVILGDGSTKSLSEITTDISGKVDKPTTDGTWMLQKAGAIFTWVAGVVQNIANTDLSNISARTFTQGNTFTWNTAGFLHYLKGLIDRTGNAAYTKVVVVHPTTGEMVTRDFADPAATTLAVQNANAGQKTAMRNALLGAGVPASPVINVVNSKFIKRGELKTLYLNGINLTPLEPTTIWIESGVVKIYAQNFYAVSGILMQTTWLIPLDFPIGTYLVKIQNGSVIQGASNGSITVVNESENLSQTILVSDFIIAPRDGYSLLPNSTKALGDNIITVSYKSTSYNLEDRSIDAVLKTPNIFLSGSSWEVILDFALVSQPGGFSKPDLPYLVLTETTSFSSPLDIIINKTLLATYGHSILNTNGTPILFNGAAGKIGISKSGNIISVFGFDSSNAISAYVQQSIDDTKDYAMCFILPRVTNNPNLRQISFQSIDILNP